MLINEDYQHVLIRSLEFDGDHNIRGFDGRSVEASEFSARYKVRITPTLLFLNSEGEEIAERILGYSTPDFYGTYLDQAIAKAVGAMSASAHAETDVLENKVVAVEGGAKEKAGQVAE